MRPRLHASPTPLRRARRLSDSSQSTEGGRGGCNTCWGDCANCDRVSARKAGSGASRPCEDAGSMPSPKWFTTPAEGEEEVDRRGGWSSSGGRQAPTWDSAGHVKVGGTKSLDGDGDFSEESLSAGYRDKAMSCASPCVSDCSVITYALSTPYPTSPSSFPHPLPLSLLPSPSPSLSFSPRPSYSLSLHHPHPPSPYLWCLFSATCTQNHSSSS